ncbi:death effector domain-containing 1 isoform X3 [Siniperca chuatsi]|uniref:death effector domain-containing 1 isoform X3 n=1 Tax=Siniperca chuatsi TaxID=119488 RepID=UPI001CE15D46|nr:death effector domain-containing 1 isoform X3 [Siniperca chuatsi]
MAAVRHPGYPLRDSLYWDETECLNYYGMLSLHEVFDIVGSQLSETDIEVLSFLLNETCPASHPLDPAGWTVEPCVGDPDDSGVSPSPELLKAWRKLKPQSSQGHLVASYKPTSGLELLLELERRGYLSDGNLEPLLQLLRVLTRHDLLPLVSHKKRRTVSPERIEQSYGIESREFLCASGMPHSCRQTEIPLPSFTQQLRTSNYPPMPGPSTRRRRKKRGNGWSHRPKKTSRQDQPMPPPPPPPPPHKVSCKCRLVGCLLSFLSTLFEGSCPVTTRCSTCYALLSSLIQSCHESTVKPHISSLKNYLNSCLRQSNSTGKLHYVIHFQCSVPHFNSCLQSMLVSLRTLRLR